MAGPTILKCAFVLYFYLSDFTGNGYLLAENRRVLLQSLSQGWQVGNKAPVQNKERWGVVNLLRLELSF